MSRTIRVTRYQHPVDIPPLQWTPTGYRRITPRGVQAPKLVYQTVQLPRPTVLMGRTAWATLNLIAFVLIAAATGLIAVALLAGCDRKQKAPTCKAPDCYMNNGRGSLPEKPL